MAAYVVVDRLGKEIESGCFSTSPKNASGLSEGLDWVYANVVPVMEVGLARDFSDGMGSPSPRVMRERFWSRWMTWKDQGALLAADCLWPVEARFLIACVEDDPIDRQWNGAYPFIDVASVRLAAGLDPLGTEDRLDREKPAHNPLADARQSARLLIEALDVLKAAHPLAVAEPTTAGDSPSPDSVALLDSINTVRAAYGRPIVTLDGKLTISASVWAAYLATTRMLSHAGFDRRIAAIYPNVAAGECIAEGQPSAQPTVADWLADPAHRAILLGDFNVVGCGVARDAGGTAYYVADFAKVSPAP